MNMKEILTELRTNRKLKYILENKNKKLTYNGYFTDENNNIVVKFWEEED